MFFTKLIVASLPLLTSALPSSLSSYGHGHEEPFFYKGFDLSSLKIMEDGGAVYKNLDNVTTPVEQILGAGGMNIVRLRLWVFPKAPYDGEKPLCEKFACALLIW